MFTEEMFNTAVSDATARLQSITSKLRKCTCPRLGSFDIDLRKLSAETIEKNLADIPGGWGKKEKEIDHIYIIGVLESRPDGISKLKPLLEAARQQENDYPRINSGHDQTGTLYVGRSKVLRSRLRQHLGAEGHDTYALHLQRWATKVNLKITVTWMSFTGADDMLIQSIEDGIWSHLKPAFGRIGER
jgi:hypothetical protein